MGYIARCKISTMNLFVVVRTRWPVDINLTRTVIKCRYEIWLRKSPRSRREVRCGLQTSPLLTLCTSCQFSVASSLLQPSRWTSASYLCIPLACKYSCFKPMLSDVALCLIVLCCFAVGSHGWNARATDDGQNEDVLSRICNTDCPTYCLIS